MKRYLLIIILGIIFIFNMNTIYAASYVIGNGTTTYSSLAAAINSASAGNTIRATAGGNDDGAAVVSKNITLDLNGQSITMRSHPIDVSAGRSLTITNSNSSQGMLTTGSPSATEYAHQYLIRNYGTLNISNSKVTLRHVGYIGDGTNNWAVVESYNGSTVNFSAGIVTTAPTTASALTTRKRHLY